MRCKLHFLVSTLIFLSAISMPSYSQAKDKTISVEGAIKECAPNTLGKGFKAIEGELDCLNKAGKGYQGLLDALKVTDRPIYYPCAAYENGPKVELKLKFKSFSNGADVLEIRSRHSEQEKEDVRPQSVSKSMAVLRSDHNAQQKLEQALVFMGSVARDACGNDGGERYMQNMADWVRNKTFGAEVTKKCETEKTESLKQNCAWEEFKERMENTNLFIRGKDPVTGVRG